MSSHSPLWQKNFLLFQKSYPVLQLTGSIDDLVPFYGELGNVRQYVSLEEWLFKVLSTGERNLLVFYSVLKGFINPYSQSHIQEFQELAGSGVPEDLSAACRAIRRAMSDSRGRQIIVIFDSSLRCLTAGPVIAPCDMRAFSSLKSAVEDSSGLMHQLIFLNESQGDLPGFLLSTQSLSKSIIVTRPDLLQRRDYLSFLFMGRNFTQTQLESVAQRADSLTLREIRMALAGVDYPRCSLMDLSRKISLFLFGFSEDPWQQLDPDKISRAREILGEYVFGQEEAVRYAAEQVQYAASGFSTAFQEDGRTAPKAVMCFCGESGTGKTELAKGLARLVLGTADAMIRFDMGEYNEPHSAERLTGSPPGYVGHDAGGQLTEAVKAHPFSLLLFDEIEKAHPTVMNKFLSILEDGRLTDGKGQTVSFENTIIVFTSNLGASEAARETDPDKIRQIIGSAVKNYCQQQPPMGIGKPELYSRLAGNIVVFNSLDQTALDRIFDRYYSQTISKISQHLGLEIRSRESFRQELQSFVDTARQNGDFPGGRGMKKAMDKYFQVPLSAFIREKHCRAGDTLCLEHFALEQGSGLILGQVTRGKSSGIQAVAPNPAGAAREKQPQQPSGFRKKSGESGPRPGFRVI